MDENEFGWLVLVATLALALVTYRRTRRLEHQIAALRGTVAALRHAAPSSTTEPEPSTPSVEAVPPEVAPVAPPVAEPSAAATPDEAPAPEHPPLPEAPAPVPPRAPSLAPAWATSVAELERLLTERWAIWLGALATALGGVFLVKYTIEQDLLGPGLRIALGGLLGLALVVGALVLRRREAQDLPPYAPMALTAAGIAVLFADIFAAYALYDFLSSTIAFVLLAGVSAGAVLLSLLYGVFIAQLGLVGAFVVPALVRTNDPSALRLFLYLAVVYGGCLALIRYTRWWWLAWSALAGSAAWVLLWVTTQGQPDDALVLGLFVLAILAATLAVAGEATEPDAPVRWDFNLSGALDIAAGTSAAALLLTLVVAVSAEPGVVTALIAVLFSLTVLGFARWRPAFEPGAALVPLFVCLLLVLWAADDPYWRHHDASSYAAIGFALAALTGAVGYALLWGAPNPGVWASVSAATPNAVLALLYWRTSPTLPGAKWVLAGLAIAALALAAAWAVERYRERRGFEIALAAYAVGVIAGVSLAAAIGLEEAWITVALAVQLPAIAWVGAKTRVVHLRWVAGILAAIVLARLLLNGEVFNYPISAQPVFNWLLYGYGIPLLAFWAAARLFKREADDVLVALLEAGALAFGLAFVTLEIRQLTGGSLTRYTYTLLEQGLQQDAWLIIGLFLLRRAAAAKRPVLVFGWRIVAGAGTLHLLLPLLFLNPILTGDPVGALPMANSLALAYLAPAALGVLYHLELARQGETTLAKLAGGAALLLGFAWVSLELRHAFHGSVLSGATTTAETYAYSVAWLVYGGALLGLGLARDVATLRYASLAVISFTVLKVFLFDMSALTGLYRAASFIGLGLSLVAIGHLYQRLVFRPRRGTS
jgi:uncharacterized membrane protein